MHLALNPDQQLIAAHPDNPRRATCPACQSPVTAHLGDLVVWHWQHLTADCDHWSEPMTAWHLAWQSAAPAYRREVPMAGHRADLVTADGRVVEIQHSHLPADVIGEREQFYGPALMWLWDCREAAEAGRIELDGDRWDVKFHWPQSRRSIGACTAPVFLDLGTQILSCTRHNDTMTWGTGTLITLEAFATRLGQETVPARGVPNCADTAARVRLTRQTCRVCSTPVDPVVGSDVHPGCPT